MEENNLNETNFEEEQTAEAAVQEEFSPETSVDAAPVEEKQNQKKSGSRFGYLVIGIVAGFLLSLMVLMLCRGYYTIQIPGIGVLSVKLPTFGVFHNADTSVDMAEFERKSEEIELYLKSYLYGTDTSQATDGAIRGFYESLTSEDDYAEYYTKEEYTDLMTDQGGTFVGIGVSVTKDDATGGVYVMSVFKDGPAYEAGLKAGDIIIEAENIDLTGLSLDEAVGHIKGEEGTSVTIKLIRDGEQLEFTMERRTVNYESVYHSVIEDEGGKIGYIYISQFLGNTLSPFREAVDDLTIQGVKGFVIDLRENPGGDMNVCLDMLDYLLEDTNTRYDANITDAARQGRTLLLSIEGVTEAETRQYFASDGHAVDLPVVLLVDSNSGSASEIFSGVMKAYGSSVTGMVTYGKGIVQNLLMLYDGSGIKYTVAEYVLPDGYHVHKTGVLPDFEVEASEELLETGVDVEKPDPVLDNQLAEAIRVLKEKIQ